MSLIEFSGESLQHLVRVLQSEIEYRNDRVAAEKKAFKQKRENERARRRELAAVQKTQLFHILTLGIFVEPEEEYFGSPMEGGFDEDGIFQDLREAERLKKIGKLRGLLNAARAAVENKTRLYVDTEDMRRMDYAYWTDVFHEAEKRKI